MGRSWKEYPASWIALGVVGLLALPPVRRALRAATVSAAVSVLKLGDGVVQVGGKVKEETQTILADATVKRDEWRKTDETGRGESWLRKTVVNGLATTLDAADKVVHGTREALYKVRPSVMTEMSTLGEPPQQQDNLAAEELGDEEQNAAVSAPHGQWQSVTDTDSETKGNLLPEHLLPELVGHKTETTHTGRRVPTDFAVRSPEAMLSFSHAVEEFGAELKPEYQQLVETLMPDELSSDSSTV